MDDMMANLMNNPLLMQQAQQMMNNPGMMQQMQQLMQNPEIMQLMQKPGMMAKLQRVMQNPSAISEYQSDEDFMKLVQIMQGMGMGGGMSGGMSGGMGMGGFGDGEFGGFGGGGGFGTGGFGGGGFGAGGSAGVGNYKNVISLTEFQETLKTSGSKPVICGFLATWCAPCKRISPVFDELSRTYTNAVFVKIDPDTARSLITSLGVKSFPTFQFYVNGQVVNQFSGADFQKLRDCVRSLVDNFQQSQKGYRHFPLKKEEMVYYKKVKYDKVAKIVNKCVNKDAHALDEKEVAMLNDLVGKLNDKSSYHNPNKNKINPDTYELIDKMLFTWPIEEVGPCLHLLRMLVMYPSAVKTYSARPPQSEQDILIRLCTIASTAKKDSVVLLALRSCANMFSRMSSYISSHYEEIFECASSILENRQEKTLRSHAMSLFINFAILFQPNPETYVEGKTYCLSKIIEFLAEENNKTTAYKMMVVLGTILYKDTSCKEIATDLEVGSLIGSISKKFASDKQIIECVKDVEKELNAKN